MEMRHLILFAVVTLTTVGLAVSKTEDVSGGPDAVESTTAPSTTAAGSVITVPTTDSNQTDANGSTTAVPSPVTSQPSPTTNSSDINGTVTTVPETTYTTVSPESSTSTDEPKTCGRKFDAASFIGGMVLALGVLSIVFFACKYYKSRTEMRYRQF